jgi:hypothetical protein
MADGQPRFKSQATPHALSDFKYRLVGKDRLEGGIRPPTISFKVRRNGIAIVGYTNVQGDEKDGQIEAMLDLNTAMYLPQMLERAIRLQPGTHEGLAIAAEVYDQETRKWKEPRLAATLRVGRDDDGVIYLSLASWKRTRPIIKIAMVPSELAKFLDGSDQPLPASVASERYALLWARSLGAMFPTGYTVNYVPPQPKGEGGAGAPGGGRSYGGGGGNRGGNNYNSDRGKGGGQQSAPPATGSSNYGSGDYDDLPM